MTTRSASVVVAVGLGSSAVALLLAPTLMPDGYSWVSHTTSESAAQGVGGGWLARLGFVLFGLSVLLLATLVARRRWGVAGMALHAGFGVGMLGTAAFSTRAWAPGAVFDPTEDMLHSVFASTVGFAFALGVVAVALRVGLRARRPRRWALDLTAVLASVLIPVGMMLLPDAAGLLQRLMFGVAYAWYLSEALFRQRQPAATLSP